MHVQSIDDPRDALSRVRRKPLENYFKSMFPQRWKAGMPADVMRVILRSEGIFQVPNAPLHRLGEGAPAVQKPSPPTPAEIEAAEDAIVKLQREWESKFSADMDINYLRKECKSRGIKISRRDNRESLARKLNGEDPS